MCGVAAAGFALSPVTQGLVVAQTVALAGWDPAVNDSFVGETIVAAGSTTRLTLATGTIGQSFGVRAVPTFQESADQGALSDPSILLLPILRGVARSLSILVPDPITNGSVTFSVNNSSLLGESTNATSRGGLGYGTAGDSHYVETRVGTVANGGSLDIVWTGNGTTRVAYTHDSDWFFADGTGDAPTSLNWEGTQPVRLNLGDASIGKRPADPQPGDIMPANYGYTVYNGAITTFDGSIHMVTDVASLRSYNDYLVASLESGAMPTSLYVSEFAKATKSVTGSVDITVFGPANPDDDVLKSRGLVSFLHADGPTATVNVRADTLLDIAGANAGVVHVSNGATAIIDGRVSGSDSDGIVLNIDTGSSGLNNGVINAGFHGNTGSQAVVIDDGSFGVKVDGAGSSFVNAATGIVNVAAGLSDTYGIMVGEGATALNAGAINLGVNNTAFRITGTDYGIVTSGSFINAATGTISWGHSAQFTPGQATTALTTSSTAVIIEADGAGASAINQGIIAVSPLAQRVTVMQANGQGAGDVTLLNSGTITFEGGGDLTVPARNLAIYALNAGNTAGSVIANTGTINLNGLNAIGLYAVATTGDGAKIANTGTINITGGIDPTGLRNYAVWVEGDGGTATATIDGAINLSGTGAIGVHARGDAKVSVTAGAVPNFLAGSDQIGFYLYGPNATIDVAAVTMSVATAGSTLFRVAEGASFDGTGLTINASGANSSGVVASGAGSVVNTNGAIFNVSGNGAKAVLVEGGATGFITKDINLTGIGAVAGIVDGQKHDISGAAVGAPDATTSLTVDSDLVSGLDQVTGVIARNKGQLFNHGNIVFTGAGATGIVATTGSTVTNIGNVTIGAGGTGIKLISTGAADLVTGTSTGSVTAIGGSVTTRTRGIQASGAGATINLLAGSTVVLEGNGAIGADAVDSGRIVLAAGATPQFSPTATDQIAFHVAGAGSSVSGVPGALDATGTRSTLFRFDNGAHGVFDATANLTASGAGSIAVVGAGLGTTVLTTGSQFVVSGSGAKAVAVYGGTIGLLDGATTIAITAAATGGLVDGRTALLDGTFGAAVPAKLNAEAVLTSTADGVRGYDVRNRGTLVHTGAITLGGNGGVGIDVANDIMGSGTVASNSGTITVSGGTGIQVAGVGTAAVNTGAVVVTTGTGAAILAGAKLTNDGQINVANGIGIDIAGAGSTLAGSASALILVGTGTAALRLGDGASVESANDFFAGGTAHGVLAAAGAASLKLGGGTVTTSGSGNGIENAANLGIVLSGTQIVAAGTGSGIRTAVALDPSSTATITAAGAGSTGFTFADTNNAATTGDLALGTGIGITATGVGATGVRLNTSGTVTLAALVTVANAAGGSAVIGGPAHSILNGGSLVSASTTAAVVDLRGGTLAFTNTGTITAASTTATAVQGGSNGQSVTLAGGAVRGAVALGTGSDIFLMTGGTLAGALTTGAGDDFATLRGLTDANLSGVTAVNGGGIAGGSDTLTFDATTSTGTRRLTGWNNIGLINASALTTDGDLVLADSTVSIDSTSVYRAGNMATAITTVGAGRVTVNNAGTIDLTNGGGSVGDSLTVRGNYVGQGGTLRLNTVLGTDGSASDRLVLDGANGGAAASGRTSVIVANTGGLGARTVGDGIEVIGAVNGAKTTALTSKDAFVLAGGHVDAGAYEYRLYASNLTGTNESWYLRTQLTLPDPTYRVEAPLIAAISATLAQGDLDMLGTYHKRMGDHFETVDGGIQVGRMWGRILGDDFRTRQGGALQPVSDGHLYGFQVGIDLFQFGTPGGGHHEIGVYAGHSNTDARVNGFASGVHNLAVGQLKPETTSVALYWTYTARTGGYADLVIQANTYDGKATASNGNRIDIGGHSILASLELGYSLDLGANWTLEPQAQAIIQGFDLPDYEIPSALVSNHNHGIVTGRIGARLKGRFDDGKFQPYLRANVWKGFASTQGLIFGTASSTTIVDSRISSLSGEGGGGLTWALTHRLALYGEVDYRFSLDHGQSQTGHSTSGTVGMKLQF